ncbi:hypothetical protein [Microbacterium sp. P04]
MIWALDAVILSAVIAVTASVATTAPFLATMTIAVTSIITTRRWARR